MCENVLSIDLQSFGADEAPTLVIKDLSESVEHANRSYVKETEVRFYAGAPLFSPAGAVVGSLCILDDSPRVDGLSDEHRYSLRDIANSVMDYLHTYTIKDQLCRGERFARGLISFSEGAEALRPFKNARQSESEHPQKHITSSLALASPHDERSDPMLGVTAPTKTRLRGERSVKKLQDTILPLDARSMFSRAATVMLASSDLDGVIILDASVAANKSHQHSGSQEGSSTTGTGGEDIADLTQSFSSSSDAGSSTRAGSTEDSSNNCQVLGVSIRKGADNDDIGGSSGFGSLSETDLSRMLQEYSNGKVITFGSDGYPLSSTDESGTSSGVSKTSSQGSPKRKSAGSRTSRVLRALQMMLPGARSVAFVPLWDYERSRWFAGCLCWSNRPCRLISGTMDLPYFKVFGHSIMRELSRLDALALNQAKTTFVASISHELRSPLHGILGTLEFLRDTSLDSFQTSMFNSLNACGQTLLDTINHVMDHAEISETTRNVSSRRLKSSNTVRLSSKPLKNRRGKAGAFDLGIATEEVVEAVFSGSSYTPASATLMNGDVSPTRSEADLASHRKACYIALDIATKSDWAYCFPVGSWRRIVMNIFGNALKYTESGHVHVALRVSDGLRSSETPATVTLTVTDSGRGMSPSFLANKAFHPFTQEDSFATGTGLGLSIVRQIIETNGGKIDVSSEPSIGTKITVRLALSKPESPPDRLFPVVSPQRSQYLLYQSRLEGRKVCILQRSLDSGTKHATMAQIDEGLVRFTNVLANTLQQHLKMNVVRTKEWAGNDADIIIAPEISFDYLKAIRRSRYEGSKAPVTIFVALDSMEAATLRSDARVRSKESVVEIMTQPCGPFKLAYILNQCLDRFGNPDENVEHHSSASESPRFSVLGDGSGPHFPQTSYHSPQSEAALARKMNETTTSDAVSSTTNSATATQDSQDSGGAQVLIVDDNSINRSLLVAFMKRHNYTYAEAENGLEALEIYQAGSSSFHTILMDMSMPVMDGMTCTRAIRFFEHSNKLPRCRIVALTGLASASARLEALSSGVDYFMTKPMKFRMLEGLLKRSEGRSRRRVMGRESTDQTKRESVFEETMNAGMMREWEEVAPNGVQAIVLAVAGQEETATAMELQGETHTTVEQQSQISTAEDQGENMTSVQQEKQVHQDSKKGNSNPQQGTTHQEDKYQESSLQCLP
ncbi:hypothetical protein BDU57DRAFT_59188 [Ampelomyces quisqualis]|uniref:histidine kinase n=1 Tax=Ampelomyces quisqualis TaxID=50730 RepID=A0A6A5R109_AMPQU|nr:hypothetical protein BDU57DRAFT_59188 [Ampelomyces quisqualis]